MLVLDSEGPMEDPAHFIFIESTDNWIIGIRDFLYAPYVLGSIDWAGWDGVSFKHLNIHIISRNVTWRCTTRISSSKVHMALP